MSRFGTNFPLGQGSPLGSNRFVRCLGGSRRDTLVARAHAAGIPGKDIPTLSDDQLAELVNGFTTATVGNAHIRR